MGELFVGFDIGALEAYGDIVLGVAAVVMNTYPDSFVNNLRVRELYFFVGDFLGKRGSVPPELAGY
ncbi:hypothetical protein ES708_35092 [subsurface metagenome]